MPRAHRRPPGHGPRPPARRPEAVRPAFTLVELLVVLVLMAVLAGAAVGSLTTTLQTRQRSAAQSLARDLRLARERALATGRQTWAVFDLAAETVSYSETVSGVTSAIAAPGTGRQWATRLDAASEGGWYNGVKLGTINGSATSPVTIGFDWRGRPLSALSAPLTTAQTVTITATGATAVTLTIQPETGTVSVSW